MFEIQIAFIVCLFWIFHFLLGKQQTPTICQPANPDFTDPKLRKKADETSMEADSLPWFYPDRPKISWNKICHSPSQLPSFCWGGSSWCKVLADGCFSRCLVFQHERTHHQLIAPNLGVFGVWYCYAILWIHQNGFSHLVAQWWKGPPTMVNRWVETSHLQATSNPTFEGKKKAAQLLLMATRTPAVVHQLRLFCISQVGDFWTINSSQLQLCAILILSVPPRYPRADQGIIHLNDPISVIFSFR